LVIKTIVHKKPRGRLAGLYSTIQETFIRVANTGVSDSTSTPEARRVRFVNVGSMLSFSFFLFYAVLGVFGGDLQYALASAVGCAANVSSILLNRGLRYNAARIVLAVYPSLHIAYTWLHYDIHGLIPMYSYICIVGIFLIFPRTSTGWMSLTLAICAAGFTEAMLLGKVYQPPRVLAAGLEGIVRNSIVIGSFVCIFSFGAVFLYFILKAQRELLDEKRKSEELLHIILPEKIASELKENPHPVGESFDDSTVIFAEITNYNETVSGLPAIEGIELLNGAFVMFEELTEKHGLEKIKTVGEIYMAVSGVPGRRADHVEAAADFAVELIARSGELETRCGRPLVIRVGMHIGPVVAGVIGNKRYSYDVWGDTVNTASRMVQYCPGGSIHVTSEVHDRLAARYDFEPRGSLEIKGKGLMCTWLLRGAMGQPRATWTPGRRKRAGAKSSNLSGYVSSSRRSE
jgi:class 3 adenylate cyclase